jgi:hypothetical protein
MDEDTEAGPYLIYLNLIEKELGAALADLDRLRESGETETGSKAATFMLKDWTTASALSETWSPCWTNR